ncbi:MAG TPA: caspase family protein [Kofleriaceae bacterium]
MLRLLIMIAIACGTAHAEQRYAIVIGSNPGWSQDRPLRYAENDAERVRDVLVSLGNFAPDRVELMRDPTTAEVRASLRRLAQVARDSANEDTLVFVYYSGHADDVNLHLRGDPLSQRELQDTLRAMPSTIKLAVVDACKSGAVTRKGGAPVDEFEVDVLAPKLSGLVILSSSGADELSQESRAIAGSVLTHHLVSGLRGAADEDGDHQVTVSEAYHYAYGRTRADTAISGASQRPAFRYELQGQGELVLTKLATPKFAQMTVPKGNDEKYVVLDQREWRLIAEAHAQKDRDTIVALAPGNYRVKRVLPDHLEVGSMSLAAGDRANVDKLSYESAPLATGVLKGDPRDLTPSEQAEWSRGQAFGLLASGQASPALAIFDRLLQYQPGDIESWRGRSRALIRLAEAYERVGDERNEVKSLGDAVKADPSLADDPMFAIWYRRLGEQQGRQQQISRNAVQYQQEIDRNPRNVKTYTVGFDLFSGSGIFEANAGLVIKRILFPRIGFDFETPGVDVSIGIAPMQSRWSPYLSLAGHMSLNHMGLIGLKSSNSVTDNEAMKSYTDDEIWGTAARIEGGAQFVSTAGFTTELGLCMMIFKADSGKAVEQMWPVFHFGWVW